MHTRNTRPGCFEVASVHVALQVARKAAAPRPAVVLRWRPTLVQRLRQALGLATTS